MLTEETHSSGVADKAASHEEAAHDRRNWVRLTFDCNDHCIFCLDADAHDGTVRSKEDIKRQILDGRRAGATRLILSGGEPTIHPSYVDFVRLGKLAGYPKVQTVTNGRMFAYGDFLKRCLDAGLSEITFSLHGPNAKVHDALVGTKGAFEEEMKGLKSALADGRPIVNVDVVVNRANVKHVAEMLRNLMALGVREFDLLQVVPFGRAFRDGRDTLFYDLDEARPHIQAMLEFSKLPDVHIWMNRFPPQHLEGYEHLIQDPYKLTDEVRGRKEEFAIWIDQGEPLDCRDPGRCKYCYLEKLCDSLEKTMARADARAFEIVRVDTEAEAHAPSAFGGDPATLKKRLPMAGNGNGAAKGVANREPADKLVASSEARTLMVVAPDAARALAVVERFPELDRLELRLDDWSGLDDLVRLRKVTRVEARTSSAAKVLLEADAGFEVVVDLTRETAAWLLTLQRLPERLALRQPTYERVTEAREHDVDLRAFFADLARMARGTGAADIAPSQVPVEGVAPCIVAGVPGAPFQARPRPAMLDLATFTSAGRLEIFRWTRQYLLGGYMTRSLRCAPCARASSCSGMHVNFVRAHGYATMTPLSVEARTVPAAEARDTR